MPQSVRERRRFEISIEVIAMFGLAIAFAALFAH